MRCDRRRRNGGGAVNGDPRLRPDSRLTAAALEAYERSGAWQPRSLRSLLADAAREHPTRIATVPYRRGRLDESGVLTYRQFDHVVSRIAAGLRGIGVGAGDVVAVMLPNRVEFGALIFAINEIGAAYSGIPATYGRREVEQILGQSGARLAVVEDGTPLAIVRQLRPALPELERVVVLPAADDDVAVQDGEDMWTELLDHEPGQPADNASSVCHIGFTSGTTGLPKGVMNTAQTLEAILRNWIEHVGGPQTLGDPVVNLIASPIGHHTGFCWGVVLTAYLGGTAVYLDRWDPQFALAVIREQHVTSMFCAPTFVQDLVQRADADFADKSPLELITIAGAPIPRSLPALAGQALGCLICPAWGMTEYAIAISWSPALGARAQETDGVPVPGARIRVMGEGGRPAPPGVVGELEMQGSGLFIGYYGRPDENAKAFDEEGWFRTGDTALVDEDGRVSLVGRSKDIVIRGGENIPVVEVESLLFDHPQVRDLAIIGLPDVRLGQRACAVVVAAPGEPPTLQQLCEHLLDQGLSKRFLPERLELVPELPKTPSGKIRKVELRERFS
jgi:cyclohexanecarboxylate-CoA ligase